MINIPGGEKILAPFYILPLEKVELEWYGTDNETSPSLHIWSTSTKFSKSNKSKRGTVDNGDHNIALDTLLENAFISASLSLSSCSQTPILSEFPSTMQPEQLTQSGRLKHLTAKPTDYA